MSMAVDNLEQPEIYRCPPVRNIPDNDELYRRTSIHSWSYCPTMSVVVPASYHRELPDYVPHALNDMSASAVTATW